MDDECRARVCTAQGRCEFSYVANDTPLAQQTAGDCKVQVCDGAGGMATRNDDADFDDGAGPECKTSSCNNGTPQQDDSAAFTACPTTVGGVCDGAGACITCVGASDCFSDGTSGAFAPASNQTLAAGEYDFTTFTIPSGVVVTVTGSAPLIVKTQGAVAIDGSLVANGAAGGNGVTYTNAGAGGEGVAGGGAGGAGYFVASGGPFPGTAGVGTAPGGGGTDWGPGAGAGHAAVGGSVPLGSAAPGSAYGDATLTMLFGGSGGGGGSGGNNCGGGGGGGGGGVIEIIAFGGVTVGSGGSIQVLGGDGGTDGGGACGGGGGGSGGSLWIRAMDVANEGTVTAAGGIGGSGWQSYVGGAGASGRVRIDAVNLTGGGTVTPASGHNAGAWYQ